MAAATYADLFDGIDVAAIVTSAGVVTAVGIPIVLAITIGPKVALGFLAKMRKMVSGK